MPGRILWIQFSFLLASMQWLNAADLSVRQGPRPLKGGSHGAGQLIPDASLTDLSGNSHKLSELTKEHRVVVVAMTSTSCPLSKKYLPTLVELSKASGDDVAWLIVNPIATDRQDDINTAAARFDDDVVYGHDRDGEFAARIGALTTTNTDSGIRSTKHDIATSLTLWRQ